MTPEQCRELAKTPSEVLAHFHEHMAEWCIKQFQAEETIQGLVAANLLVRAREHRESARYWREKADE